MAPIKSSLAIAAALSLVLTAQAQEPRRPSPLPPGNPFSRQSIPTNPAPQTKPAPKDSHIIQSGQSVPDPIHPEQLPPPSFDSTDIPLEPYQLTTQAGPFMVMARTFRGPDAQKFALALAHELHTVNKLPAYVYYLKIQPGRSNIQGEYPTAAAPGAGAKGSETAIEKFRIHDEAAVLVGNCKSIDDSEDLLKIVKKLHPKCLEKMPSIWQHRQGQGLKYAMLTTNPLIPAQYLYPGPKSVPAGMASAPHGAKPGEVFDPFLAVASLTKFKKPDPLVKRMNGGSNTLSRCPGDYSLQVAEFAGRQSLIQGSSPTPSSDDALKTSPLITAHEDAERLAENIMKCKATRGLKAYTFHDRDSSKVYIGAFSGPNDPAYKQVYEIVPALMNELMQKGHINTPLVPSLLTPVPRD